MNSGNVRGMFRDVTAGGCLYVCLVFYPFRGQQRRHRFACAHCLVWCSTTILEQGVGRSDC